MKTIARLLLLAEMAELARIGPLLISVSIVWATKGSTATLVNCEILVFIPQIILLRSIYIDQSVAIQSLVSIIQSQYRVLLIEMQ